MEKHEDYTTVTSVDFEITHPYASFRIGGGPDEGARVELALADEDVIFLTVSGLQKEEMRPVVVDLEPHLGRRMFVASGR